MVEIDDKMIAYLEDLSLLRLTEDEKASIKASFMSVLGGMERFENLDAEGVEECIRPIDNVNDFREDVAGEPLGRELILKNAPQHNEEMFIAPKTVGD